MKVRFEMTESTKYTGAIECTKEQYNQWLKDIETVDGEDRVFGYLCAFGSKRETRCVEYIGELNNESR